MNSIKKSKTKKFVTGEPRYCQNCGKESHQLFQVTKETQKINQLQYCEECKKNYDKNLRPQTYSHSSGI